VLIPLGLDIMPEGPLKPNEEEESVLIDMDAEVDSRCLDERRKRESVEVCTDDEDELRVGVCTGAACAWRLNPLRRGRRIFRDGVEGVVFDGVATAEGGVEGGAARKDAGCTGVAGAGGMGAGGASMEAGVEGFSLAAVMGSLLSLDLKLRGLRLISTGVGSGCIFCQQSQYTNSNDH
jgi:hypothetical protein